MPVTRCVLCPSCGEVGREIKSNYFRCLNCGSMWKETGDLEEKIFKRRLELWEQKRVVTYDSVDMDEEFCCARCGRIIKFGVQSWNRYVPDIVDAEKKYCLDCGAAIAEGKFGRASSKRQETRPIVNTCTVDQVCTLCRKPLGKMKWNEKVSLLVCNNGACIKFHSPQGRVRG